MQSNSTESSSACQLYKRWIEEQRSAQWALEFIQFSSLKRMMIFSIPDHKIYMDQCSSVRHKCLRNNNSIGHRHILTTSYIIYRYINVPCKWLIWHEIGWRSGGRAVGRQAVVIVQLPYLVRDLVRLGCFCCAYNGQKNRLQFIQGQLNY